MKYTFFGFGVILFGLLGIFFLMMFQQITTNNESEYYVIKEAMEASMLESVDLTCYRLGDKDGYVDLDGDDALDDINNDGIIDTSDKYACGDNDIKIVEQKFVENFTRRFAASVSGNVTEYKIEFYDIIESPPKATVVIYSKTPEYLLLSDKTNDSIEYTKETFTITNDLSGILEIFRDDD